VQVDADPAVLAPYLAGDPVDLESSSRTTLPISGLSVTDEG
jgi:hypothetical protein